MTSLRRLSIAFAIAASMLALTVISAGASRHQTEPANCTAASVPLGATLPITGSGYQPGATYTLDIVWPNHTGTGGTAVRADSSGTWSKTIWAYFSGTYTFDVYTMSGSPKLLATCSTTVS